ncbi:DUF6456 domain-containing protein [Paracoccus alkenifer]|uniref:Helix-turn-helix domain-containing protein n=1 Tax=Paracoccus alkenifer TaxID=65735 RepID=A0A1H6M124_9RHOB|nr:DUF6456 domain-containing protein [Paracoccus alkenifer]SEH91066.1 Helix-turn-helix domain-containing protein [Paracoccus alkenifer]
MTILTGGFSGGAAVPPFRAAVPPGSTARAGQQDQSAQQIAALPDDARLYLRHVQGGESIRALARETGCHASTILRRIRRFESRRDDPLVDRAVDAAGQVTGQGMGQGGPSSADLAQARRVLRRLAEPGAVLAVAEGMDKAIVTRADIRTAILDRRLAEMLALNGWVTLVTQGRITRHRISAAGRAALKSMAAGRGAGLPLPRDFGGALPVGPGMAEAQAPYAAPDQRGDQRPGQPPCKHPDDLGPAEAQAHRVMEDREIDDPEGGRRRARFNAAESPLQMMARRRDANGQPFLDPGMVAAGERLREDFELAQMGTRITQNWDGFMTAGIDAGFAPGAGGGSDAARSRVAEALRELGPGMGDLVLRVCCFLEGIEMTERRLGWSARSGKVVLRLALMRLERHYLERYGRGTPMIG